MHKFKVGDKVTCIDGYKRLLQIGDTYTIRAVNNCVQTVSLEGVLGEYFSDRFKLAVEPITCKFKPGKKYKTRDGREAIVYAVYPEQLGGYRPTRGWPIHGAILVDGRWEAHTWGLNGDWCGCSQKVCSDNKFNLMPNKRTVYIGVGYLSAGSARLSCSPPQETEELVRHYTAHWKWLEKIVPFEIED